MSATYSPASLGIKPPSGGFQQGGWYSGRQYWNGTLSDPGVIHPASNQQGAGQAVSKEVNAQSAGQMGMTSQQVEQYLQAERDKQANANPTAMPYTPDTSGAGFKGGGSGAGAGIAGMGVPNATALDLPALYERYFTESGIKDSQANFDTLQGQIDARKAAANEAKGKINDNPFYSEGTRVGRVAKLDEKVNGDVNALTQQQQVIQDKIATQRADIETKLNLQTKQFDINSQVARDALNQFNVLLDSGALDNASGEDIANLTRATGMSSSMISSAVNARQEKNVQTSTISFDDGTNQGFAVINSKTGEIISKQTVAASKPEKSSSTATESDKKSYYASALRNDAASGMTLSQILQLYTGYIDPNEIYQLYNANSKYGPDKGNIRDLAKYGITKK